MIRNINSYPLDDKVDDEDKILGVNEDNKTVLQSVEKMKKYLATELDVDDSLSATSKNALQNKIIKEELDKKAPLSGDVVHDGNVTITQNLTVLGSKIIQHETDLEIDDPIITLNKGETGSGVSSGLAGLEIDRGLDNNYFIGMREDPDQSRSLVMVGQTDSENGKVQSLSGNVLRLESTDTGTATKYVGKRVRLSKEKTESKFPRIIGYNETDKTATLDRLITGVDNTWDYRILYREDLNPVALWDITMSDDCIMYWDAKAMLLRDTGIKKNFMDRFHSVAFSGNYNDIKNKPTVITLQQSQNILDNNEYRNIGHIPLSQKGSANGVATLNSEGLIPTNQIAGGFLKYDTYPTKSNFPTNGDSNTIYISEDTNKQYRWTGSDYLESSVGDVRSVFGRKGSITAQESDYAKFYAKIHGDSNNDFNANVFFEDRIKLIDKYALINGNVNNPFNASTFYENGISLVDMYANIHGSENEDFNVKNLNVNEYASFNKSIGTPNFISGITGRGWRIDDKANAEFNDGYFRGSLTMDTFINNKINITNGDIIVTDSATIDTIVEFNRIAFTEPHPFKVGDKLKCKQLAEDNISLSVYYLQVQWVGHSDVGYWIAFTKTGTATPKAKDLLVLWNSNDVTRKGLLYLSSSSSNAPFYDVVYDEKAVSRFGNLSGIHSALFGDLSGYGFWTENGYFEGSVNAKTGKISNIIIDKGIRASNNGFALNDDGSMQLGNGAMTYDVLNGFLLSPTVKTDLKGDTGANGLQGVQGIRGNDGVTTYTWIKYADDINGGGISNLPLDKAYIGLAYNKTTETESNTPAHYEWSLMKGGKGDTGIKGASGVDGQTKYTWIKYSDYSNGNPMYDVPENYTKYIGIAINKDTESEIGSIFTDYIWSKFKGEVGDKGEKGDKGTQGVNGLQGIQGNDGTQGIKGNKGNDGISSYFHIKYSDYPNGTSMNDTGGKYIGTYIDSIKTDSSNISDYVWVLVKGSQGDKGEKGIHGVNGITGKSSYLHIKYSNYADGTSMNDVSGLYIGTYTDDISQDSNIRGDYNWVLIKGDTGDKGNKGDKGDSFKVDEQGLDANKPNPANKDVGYSYFATDTSLLYFVKINHTWSDGTDFGKGDKGDKGDKGTQGTQGVRGLKGLQGNKGEQGIVGTQGIKGNNGSDGSNGVNSYFHIKYSNHSDGTGMNDVGGLYIGTYVDNILLDSNIKSKYNWVLVRGAQGNKGEQGLKGINGNNGKSSYLHIKYSNYADGTSMNDISGLYIGTYTDNVLLDSTEKNDYAWNLIKGDKGNTGDRGATGGQGVKGNDGLNGKSLYTWMKYADDVNGGGISDSPIGKKYIGFAYNKNTPNEANVANLYEWSLIKGAKGDVGVKGANGINGAITYTWIKYSDSYNGANMYDIPKASTKYIGIAVNKTTQSESGSIPSNYVWSKFRGETGAKGNTGDTGAKGNNGTNGSKGDTGAFPVTYNPPATYSGLAVTSSHLGYFKQGLWMSYMDENGAFELKGTGEHGLAWNPLKDLLTINGEVNAVKGNIGGWNLNKDMIASPNIPTTWEKPNIIVSDESEMHDRAHYQATLSDVGVVFYVKGTKKFYTLTGINPATFSDSRSNNLPPYEHTGSFSISGLEEYKVYYENKFLSTSGIILDSNGVLNTKNFVIDNNGDSFFRGELDVVKGKIGGWDIYNNQLSSKGITIDSSINEISVKAGDGSLLKFHDKPLSPVTSGSIILANRLNKTKNTTHTTLYYNDSTAGLTTYKSRASTINVSHNPTLVLDRLNLDTSVQVTVPSGNFDFAQLGTSLNCTTRTWFNSQQGGRSYVDTNEVLSINAYEELTGYVNLRISFISKASNKSLDYYDAITYVNEKYRIEKVYGRIKRYDKYDNVHSIVNLNLDLKKTVRERTLSLQESFYVKIEVCSSINREITAKCGDFDLYENTTGGFSTATFVTNDANPEFLGDFWGTPQQLLNFKFRGVSKVFNLPITNNNITDFDLKITAHHGMSELSPDGGRFYKAINDYTEITGGHITIKGIPYSTDDMYARLEGSPYQTRLKEGQVYRFIHTYPGSSTGKYSELRIKE